MDADFVAETEGLSISALEDLLYFWEEMGSLAIWKANQIRDTLRGRYEKEEIDYWTTEWGLVRGHDGTRKND